MRSAAMSGRHQVGAVAAAPGVFDAQSRRGRSGGSANEIRPPQKGSRLLPEFSV